MAAARRARRPATSARADRALRAALFGSLLFAAPLSTTVHAQERSDPNVGRLRGTVVDALGGAPIGGALVVLEEDRAVLTDSLGAFDLGEVASGGIGLTVRQYGYEILDVIATVPPGEELAIEVPLTPRAVLVDGLSVVMDRLELMERRLRSRRTAVASSVHAFEQERLVGSSARDLLEFIRTEGMLHMTACGRASWSGACVWRRGRPVEPRVFIDEVPLIGGLDYLTTYRPHELYLLEVYARGLEIRAYTHNFMERMAVKPVALFPIGLWP